ncbi:MAG: L,D-transpeptidase family protein [Chloroflexi bacterium]|nr:L,D-transpeptidase family protein [Chloroflexota bacterium]
MNNRLTNSHAPAQSGGNSPRNGSPAQGPAKKRNLILPLVLIITGCAVFMFAAWSAVRSPVLASILNGGSNAPQFQQVAPGQSFAQVYIAKPTYTPMAVEPVAQQIQPAPTFTQVPQPEVAVVPPTDAPPAEVVVQPTATTEVVAAVETGVAVAEAAIIPDTPTAEYVAPPTAVAYVPPASTSGGSGGVHWFDVDLSEQRMYAYEGDTLVNTFVVSTGTWQTPTVTGKFKVWIKLRSAPMSGPGYYLPDVPYIMYFYGDYGIHGTYWHNNFGVPMSHGCVNLSIPDAEWAYNFASVGTVVNVHD